MENLGSERRFLNSIDYCIIAGMLVFSAGIGIYFAITNKKRPNTTAEYLTGSRELLIFPIVMSLASSHLSGIAFLAYPSEVYLYGSQILMTAFSATFAIIATLYIFIPIFCSLNIVSSYEYFTQRFNSKIGMLASVLFIVKGLFYSAIVTYIPAIAFSQLSGLKIEISVPILSLICILYTAIGGLRGVVWADTLQTIFMIICIFATFILGTYHVGGLKHVWERNVNSERIELFNFDPDPTTRVTFWTTGVGMFFFSLTDKVSNQMMVQRCLALSTVKKIKITVWFYAILSFVMLIVNGLNGLVAFAVFYDCDPVTTKTVPKPDQIIPYLWMILTREIPGLPGFLVAGLFSASLSTVSTVLNCISGVFVINVVKPVYSRTITEAKATFLMKVMVFIFGCLLLGLSFLIDKMGTLFQVGLGFMGLINGPIFGIFTLGMFCPRAGSKAVLIASLVSLAFVTWIFVGAQIAISQKQIIQPTKNFSIEGCDNDTLESYYSYAQPSQNNFNANRVKPFPLYAISYQYYAMIGAFTTVVVGVIVSYFKGCDEKERRNINLYSPIVRKFIRIKIDHPEEEMKLNAID